MTEYKAFDDTEPHTVDKYKDAQIEAMVVLCM